LKYEAYLQTSLDWDYPSVLMDTLKYIVLRTRTIKDGLPWFSALIIHREYLASICFSFYTTILKNSLSQETWSMIEDMICGR